MIRWFEMDVIVLSQTMKSESPAQQDVCNVSASPMHNVVLCPSLGHQEGISELVT